MFPALFFWFHASLHFSPGNTGHTFSHAFLSVACYHKSPAACRRSHWLCRDYFSLKFFTNYFDQWQTLTCIIMPRLGVYNPSILHRINVSARKKYSKSCTQILNFVTSNPKSPFTFTSGPEISDPIEGSVWKSKNIGLSVELSLNCFTFARFYCF